MIDMCEPYVPGKQKKSWTKEAFDDGFVLGFACGAGSIVLLVAIWRLGTLIFGG